MSKLHALVPKAIADRRPEILNRSIHKKLSDCTVAGLSEEFYVISFQADSKKEAPSVYQSFEILDTDEAITNISGSPEFHRLIISEEVNSNQSSAETLVIPDGATATITKASASASFVADAVVKVVWDWDEAGEEVIWTMKGEGSMPFEHQVTGDGVKKLAIELENTSGGARWLSGLMEVFIDG